MKSTISKFNKMFLYTALLAFSTALILFGIGAAPHLTAQFGISGYAAKKIIDIATGAGSIWAIIAVIGGSAGWGAALLAAAKGFVKAFGKKAAAAW